MIILVIYFCTDAPVQVSVDTYFCVCVWIIFENVSGSCLSYSYLDLCNRLKDLLPVYKKNISSSCKKKPPLFKR